MKVYVVFFPCDENDGWEAVGMSTDYDVANDVTFTYNANNCSWRTAVVSEYELSDKWISFISDEEEEEE